MMRLFFTASLALLAGCASVPKAPASPLATEVAVAFDTESVRPVVVEGMADRSTMRPALANDPVRIASISKLVMALTTMHLVEEGKVDLDRDISDYLGWKLRHPDYPDVPVTLAQLLSHRSGLRDDAGYVIPLGESLQAKFADPAAWYHGAPPGEAPFEYANVGSPLVATVLEAASGERYDRLVERTVFAPLGIEACLNWIGCAQDFAERAVVLYRSTGEVGRDAAGDRPPNCTIPIAEGAACNLEAYVPGTNASIFSPQGGVRIGMVDLARLGQAIMNEDSRLLGSAGFARLKRQQPPTAGSVPLFCVYGLAVQTLQPGLAGCNDDLFPDVVRRYGHAGEAYGLRSGLWIDPEGRRGIAYFVTAVPEPEVEDTGGFSDEERALVARAVEIASRGKGRD